MKEKLIERIIVALGTTYDAGEDIPDFDALARVALWTIIDQGYVIVNRADLGRVLEAIDDLRIIGEAS